jgi:hypothetical protein
MSLRAGPLGAARRGGRQATSTSRATDSNAENLFPLSPGEVTLPSKDQSGLLQPTLGVASLNLAIVDDNTAA